MYTKDDYLKDLYLKDHAIRDVEKNAAATRCRMYEMGKTFEYENDDDSYSSYTQDDYLNDLYLKDHATRFTERSAAEMRANAYERGRIGLNNQSTNDNDLFVIVKYIFYVLIAAVVGYILITKTVPGFVTFIFDLIFSSDNNANGGIFFKTLMIIAPIITGVYCLIREKLFLSDFSEGIPIGLVLAIVFVWVVGGFYDYSHGESLLKIIFLGFIAYPICALLLQIFILPIFYLITRIVCWIFGSLS